MAIVVDTSVIMATLMGEPERSAILRATKDVTLIAAASLPLEIGNALSAGFKRRKYSLQQANRALQLFGKMELSICSVDVSAAVRLSFDLQIYAYDAYVLQCARDAGAPLLTLDRGQAAAAKRVNLELTELTDDDIYKL